MLTASLVYVWPYLVPCYLWGISTVSNVSVFNGEISDHKSLTFSVHHILQEQHPHGKAQLRSDFRHVNTETLTCEIMPELSHMDPLSTHPDTIMDQSLLLILHWLNSLLVYFGGHARGGLHLGTVLIAIRRESFAVTMRLFGEHPAWKYAGTSV